MIDSHLIAHTCPNVNPENVVLLGDVRVSVLTDRLFRIERDSDRKFCDEATQSVWFRNLPAVSYTVEKKGASTRIKTDKAILVLRDDPAKTSVILDGKEIYLSKVENLPGAYRSLDRCEGDYYMSEKHGNYHIKLEDGVVSKSGVGVHDDTKSLILGSDGRLSLRDDDDSDCYVFAYGKDFRGAIQALFAISGRVPLIPRYALGNWWSRYHDYTQEEYQNLILRFEEENIPFSVSVVDMDWHVVKIPEEYKNGETE